MEPIRIGIAGYGYWGPKLVRNFTQSAGFEVAGVADLAPERLARARADFGVGTTTTDLDELLADERLEAIAIATPISTHADLARRALEAGKHVWLEKPMAHSAAACDELVRIARERGRVLLVDHTFLYTGAVEKMRELIASGALGRLYYFDSVRVNLGLFQHDYNVVWDLAPHDLSILLHLIDDRPVQVQATGAAPIGTGTRLESVAYVTIHFASGLIGHCHVNWLAPKKIRLMQIAGSKQMLVWDDVEPDTKIKVYDAGVELPEDPTDPAHAESKYQAMVQYRTGDMWAPRLDKTEALRKEAEHFFRCVRAGERPRSGGELGRDVVALLEAAQLSIDAGGVPVDLLRDDSAAATAGPSLLRTDDLQSGAA
jgi:predicted dehydrogenase